ncbi:MAG: DNA polymerase III subunit delta [Alphaproteobacteria bacterium]|nr:MAG: DNA polymerase III subunit delta [Alphaproteobacteria bacterium]
MKLSGRDARRLFEKPDAAMPAVLVYGADPMRVAAARNRLVERLVGPHADAEMRLARIPAADLRRDPAALQDALRAQGFFPGARAVVVEDATDALTRTVDAALSDWRPGDATLIVSAGALPARSSLRKLFEAHPKAAAAPVYDDPPGRDEVEAMLAEVGAPPLNAEAMRDLLALAAAVSPGDLRQTIEKLALYKLGGGSPATAEDLAAVVPSTTETGIDELVHAVAEGRQAEVAPLLRKLWAQGIQPVQVCIAAERHFAALHRAASDPSGPERGIAAVRPPVFGPRRNRMVRQAGRWRPERLETALRLLTETDLTLRSGRPLPMTAMVERAMIRLAIMARGR